MKLRLVSSLTILNSVIISTNLAAAPNFTISGTIPASITLNQTNSKNAAHIKHISLQKVVLSQEAKKYIANHANNLNSKNTKNLTTALPPSVSLGMENVPVLDQGEHGTCATFASTGAVNAILKKGDYISQLCNLELSAYLNSLDDQYDNGWEGSDNETVLGQIQKYGIVDMKTQRSVGCGTERKVYEYPLNDDTDMGVPMNVDDFTRIAQPMNTNIYWKSLLSTNNAYTIKANEENVIANIKQALFNGHRVVFGMLLDIDGDLLFRAGAVGKYHIQDDTWILTDKIKEDFKKLIDENIPEEQKPTFAGHAMIVTGYDDNAIIIEETSNHERIEHKGMFTLRNSNGKFVGDNGNYYVSYDYFKLLANEVDEVSPTPLQ